jgi:hypothetical protein
MSEVGGGLSVIEKGGPAAADQLLGVVDGELRCFAAQKLARQAPRQTVQATALVHEAYLRLVGQGNEPPWDSWGTFLAAAAAAKVRK